MNKKELGEIRRRQKRDRSSMNTVYGCYVNDQKEIVADFKRSTAIMSENEAEKYFAIMRRILGGTRGDSLGKNILDINFRTSQVVDSPEHQMLMGLRGQGIENEENRTAFYQKVIENLDIDASYLIILGTENYDVPFRSKDCTEQADNSSDVYTYVICAICPVKQTKAVLHYEPDSKDFQDGNMVNAVSHPELGFLFPAFDDRTTNLYSALYFNRSHKDNHEAFAAAVFNTPIDKPAEEQKATFDSVIAEALDKECSMEVVQSIHDELRQQITLHAESKVSEPLTISKEQISQMLTNSGVSEDGVTRFTERFDGAFGANAQVYPGNIIDVKKLRVKTADVTIQVAANQSNLIQTRVIGGVKYILIQADESVEVNGIPIFIDIPKE